MHESQVFPIIGTIVTKRSSAALVRAIFRGSCIVGCTSVILYDSIAMWPLSVVFMLIS